MKKIITLKDIESLDAPTITPAQAADVLGVNPQSLRIQAREDKASLGFPVSIIGTRIVIPREAFLRHMRGESCG